MAQLAQVQRVDERDQVHTGDVEAVPAVANRARAEGVSVLLSRVVDGVVLARHGEHVVRLQTAHHLLRLVELFGAGKVSEVAGVDDEIRCVAEAVDLVDRVAERRRDVPVGRTVEAEVAVADLGEPQGGPDVRALSRRLPGDMRDDLAPGHDQPDRRPEPRRVPEELAPGHGIVARAAGHPVTTTVPRIIG